MEELLNKLRVIWKDKAKIRQEGSNRVELEVTYYMDKAEWKERMKEFTDTSKTIPDSWTYNGIRIVAFTGEVRDKKKSFNLNY